MSTYTIGQVAERTGFSPSTLRYYEQHDLLRPVARSDAGYRLYDDASLARLGFIDRAKHLGCTLEEIADLLVLWEADDCSPVQARFHDLVTAKIADAQLRSAALIRFTEQLHMAAAHLGGDPTDGPCTSGCVCLTEPSETGLPGRTESIPVVLGHSDPAVACTLPAGAMADRVAAWRAVLAHVTERTRTADGGLRLSLDADVPLDELARLAAAEQGCCAFFAFAITFDGRGVAFEVRAPDGAAEVVTALFGGSA